MTVIPGGRLFTKKKRSGSAKWSQNENKFDVLEGQKESQCGGRESKEESWRRCSWRALHAIMKTLDFTLIKAGNYRTVLIRFMFFKTSFWLLVKNGLQQSKDWKREASERLLQYSKSRRELIVVAQVFSSEGGEKG